MNKIKIFYLVLFIIFGVFMFVYGGYDDSPGGQGMGLVAVTVGVIGLIKIKKKRN